MRVIEGREDVKRIKERNGKEEKNVNKGERRIALKIIIKEGWTKRMKE